MVTAIINIKNNNNQPIHCRTLLDTAATCNLITERLANTLGLPKRQYSVSVGGLGDIQTATSYKISATIQSRYNNFEKSLELYTVAEITKNHPTKRINKDNIQIPTNVNLADPTFNIPGQIDMLIGAGPALATFIPGQKNLSAISGPDLFMQNTQFGWVIGGAIFLPVNNKTKTGQGRKSCHLSTTQALQQLTKTWAIEEGPKIKHFSMEEAAFEAHYKTNTSRNIDGKYTVALPFNSKQSLLGETRVRALNRLKTLENKFRRNSEFKRQYAAVIQEYMELGHMEPARDSTGCEGFYLPHHAVIKESSLTTKTRVVFDGSAKSSTGLSLNETLMVGPTIQDNIITHLIRFRLHIIVISGDIEKMYRQIWVQPSDRKYQKILWRDDSGSIQDYQLKTVTFGLAPAPFLAIRTLYQLAEDEQEKYPTAAERLKRDMYVDDLLTGADTVTEAIKLRSEIEKLLQTGGFNIRKWASNDSRILEGVSESNINQQLQFELNPTLKTLGIHWQAQSDYITYTLNKLPTEITMRTMLAEIAKIFDPLGLLSPIIIAARLILQDCWRQGITWDQELPENIKRAWFTYATEFNTINNISYNRLVILPFTINIQLHGFADASEKAYGACIYLRCITVSGKIQTHLLCSKTKIAPLQNISLARLELCAALILANLYETIKENIHLKISNTVFWTDSTIALHWINTPPYQLKTFVANRVAEIQTKTQASNWRHVRSADNPADAPSRGQSPKEFLKNKLWSSGPAWLNQKEVEWPTSIIQPPTEDDEKRKFSCLTTCMKVNELDDSFIKVFKSINTLHRTIAYCLRFLQHNKTSGEIESQEIQQAQRKIVQQQVQESSKLKCLSPFLDENGIIRVGGRLEHSKIPYDQKHPIILPQSHSYTTLVIQETHRRHFHAGTQMTLYAVRRQFWPINGRNEVKRVTHQCIRCIKAKPHTATYTMGNLPKERVTQTRPFYHTGIDYCGPFFIKERKHQNRKKVKIYVAIFVCLAVKAVHMEIVSDLTSDGFLAALKRFIARRGKCHTIHSDNGTNFVGANNQLKEIHKQMNSDDHQQKVKRYLANEGIQWKFIPARSPNFGGLWEAAVKSFKNHMIRMVGDSLLSFEEFNTFTIEIEAILNSRPLTPISSNPNDPIAITPGHFLIGDSLTSLPEHIWADVPSNRLSSWQHIQKLKQAFWKRWHKEYINGLNIKSKWHKGNHNIQEGSIVIIKDDNARPLHWPLGRVIQVHPGTDGITRTVSIKTANGIIDRNVRNLAILLPNQDKTDIKLIDR